MKYIIYQRVSTDKQDVEIQQSECLNYIKNKEKGNSFEYNVFEDPETSSRVKMKNRVGLMQFLDSLRAGQHVVIYKLDRLSRDIIEMVTIYRMIKDKKCTIYSLNDPDCDNEFMIGLMGVLAQKERKDISDRTKSALKNKQGKRERTGNVPYGYTLCPNRLVSIKNKRTGESELKPGILIELASEQDILDRMRDLFMHGLSYRQIASSLNEQGYRNREGSPFQHMSVFRILRRIGLSRSSDPLHDETKFQMFLAQV